jgi:hypothetical protein
MQSLLTSPHAKRLPLGFVHFRFTTVRARRQRPGGLCQAFLGPNPSDGH